MNAANPFRISLYLILLTHLVFFPVVTFHFLNYDDSQYVYQNPMVCHGLSAQGLEWAWTTFHVSNWHPLSWLSHMLDWQLFGDRPGLHHYVNLLLHLASALEEQGNHPEAAQEYQEGLRLDASWPERTDKIAQDLLTTKNPKMRCPAEALFRAKQACQATGDGKPEMLETLAAAYAASGKLGEAVAAARKARELAGNAGRSDLVQEIQGQLRLYEAGLAKKS